MICDCLLANDLGQNVRRRLELESHRARCA